MSIPFKVGSMQEADHAGAAVGLRLPNDNAKGGPRRLLLAGLPRGQLNSLSCN